MSYNTNVRFVLKNINSKDVGCVNLEIVFIHKDNKKKIRRYVNTGEYVHKTDFDSNGIKSYRHLLKSAKLLVEKRKLEFEELLRNLELNNGEITPDIYDVSQRINEDAKKNIFQLFDKFIEFKTKKVESRTIQKYNTLKVVLEDFIPKKKHKNTYTTDITLDFLEELTTYLSDKKDLSINTIAKYQSVLNTFMDYLTDTLKVNKNLAYKEYQKISRKKESESKVVLLKEHVQKIIDWTTDDKTLETVKDLFLFQIMTGVRISDLLRISKYFVKNKMLSFQMFKTTTTVNIPLHPMAKEILTKYDYTIGKKCKEIGENQYNTFIKDVCKNAGLTEEVSSLRITLNKKIPVETPLYKLVSSHVGRTTFVTNCLISGISPFIVMGYTGHRKIETLHYYMKIAGDISQDAFIKYEDYFKFE
nr:phage integrase SAM-like domain-containing protein [uncultured Draconibacterium sp.]